MDDVAAGAHLRAADPVPGFEVAPLQALVDRLRAQVSEVTGGLTASVGVASSKFMAKIASELAKPDGSWIVPAGTERALLQPMKVGVIPGVGPVTVDKLQRIGVHLVGDLEAAGVEELAQVIGRTHATALVALASARDDRPVEPEREAKSISVEDTFATDLTDRAELAEILRRDARSVASRLTAARLFARTVTIKVRRPDFSTLTRARTLRGATDRVEVITTVAQSLLEAIDVTGGIRLLGVGVAGLTDLLQEDLFALDEPAALDDVGPEQVLATEEPGDDHAYGPAVTGWSPGADVEHDAHGPGWVWGAGRGRVTVRFETRETPPGPVRTFADDDPALHRRAVA